MQSSSPDTAQKCVALLQNKLSFSHYMESFSPFYSDIGLSFSDKGGIDFLNLHYNRKTRSIGPAFFKASSRCISQEHGVLGISQVFETGTCNIRFYDRNSFIVDCNKIGNCSFSFYKKEYEVLSHCYQEYDAASSSCLFHGYLGDGDSRDPDMFTPIILGVKVINGNILKGNGISDALLIEPDANGRILIAFSCNLLSISNSDILHLLAKAPLDTAAAEKATFGWFQKAIGKLSVFSDKDTKEEQLTLASCVFSLISNCCIAPGYLENRISGFPNRGSYPCVFLWDTFFQNLAYEFMDSQIARDSVLVLTDNLRPDGKMAHFLCSTWIRPMETQPPLIGWAALKLIKARNDLALAGEILEPLMKNTHWWLTHRMTPYGLVCSFNPYETGWDDTPRFDRGAILPCDINTYLYTQMTACAEMAAILGKTELSLELKEKAQNYRQKMLDLLYDPAENIFKDVLVETGEQLPYQTPACFLPLFTDVLPKPQAVKMISSYLLNPNKFFGDIPFPSLAYDEPEYYPDKWWRGPTWMPIAYFMLELLKKYGFNKEASIASNRLYNMILKDRRISEVFNSKTGEGMGGRQQGWTAAILLNIKTHLIHE